VKNAGGLKDLLERMREHPCFPDLLEAVKPPDLRQFRPGKDQEGQKDEFVFRSGRIQQHTLWQEFLTKFDPLAGNQPSQQEKS
jgi:hypothetical protein